MKEHLPFIDWMKALGMLVIIYGHAPAGGLVRFTEPFNPKQLGVAFFIFVLGFSLARETRSPLRVLFNRLFEVFLWGLAAAIVMSFFLLITKGDIGESNYLPFLFGVNVLFNFFPANQTTWYIGMYLHMVLFWVLLARRWRVEPWMLCVALAAEVLLRAALLRQGADFVAYMLLTNWIAVFLLGMWFGQKEGSGRSPRKGLLPYLGLYAVVVVVWPLLVPMFDPETDFPFNLLNAGNRTTSWLLTSTSISLLYLLHTWLVFEITSRLPDVRLVRFLARNTLFVFIVHLPLVRILYPWIYQLVSPIWARIVVNILVYFLGLSLVSEGVRRAVPTQRLKESLAHRFFPQATVQ